MPHPIFFSEEKYPLHFHYIPNDIVETSERSSGCQGIRSLKNEGFSWSHRPGGVHSNRKYTVLIYHDKSSTFWKLDVIEGPSEIQYATWTPQKGHGDQKLLNLQDMLAIKGLVKAYTAGQNLMIWIEHMNKLQGSALVDPGPLRIVVQSRDGDLHRTDRYSRLKLPICCGNLLERR